ncbi:predicted protein [Sclerotinia sclerotiorum 1980 UF-70]|uniref:Uncharacterized protein n=1 Tax=Sclerotinia sclerotiorum (strain ATCC 18683 / 1980 / Ss-1) TaxID=665079 RepID=A7F963_SCLS1|nr:predicted protein [Sclerotinia sclerotiorum 1980 UF-70]EDO00274.1 predicted protein [Sclerotinia sclerotiorum 1980 UF-70]
MWLSIDYRLLSVRGATVGFGDLKSPDTTLDYVIVLAEYREVDYCHYVQSTAVCMKPYCVSSTKQTFNPQFLCLSLASCTQEYQYHPFILLPIVYRSFIAQLDIKTLQIKSYAAAQKL